MVFRVLLFSIFSALIEIFKTPLPHHAAGGGEDLSSPPVLFMCPSSHDSNNNKWVSLKDLWDEHVSESSCGQSSVFGVSFRLETVFYHI